MRSTKTIAVLALWLEPALGCGGAPPSRLPDGQAAIDRMRASYGCEAALEVDDGKVDVDSASGRVRTDVMMLAASPTRFRLDVATPVVGGAAAVLTSDGNALAFGDLRNQRFTTAPANACAMQRFTKLAVPPPVLVTLLLGHAPVLRHLATPTVAWGGGRYHVTIAGNDGALEDIELAPRAEDWAKPWSAQRFVVTRVRVAQQGITLYDAELADRQVAPMAPPPPGGLATALGTTIARPTGPTCTDATIPRRVHVVVPTTGDDVIVRLDRVVVNPWLEEGTFVQSSQNGMTTEVLECR